MVQLVNTIKLYQDPVRIWLTQIGNGVRNNNLPLDDNDFKAFKGVTSSVEFSVRNNDRRPIDLEGKTLIVTIYNPTNGELMLQKEIEVFNAKRGLARLIITPTDVVNWDPGFYRYSVIIENDDNTQNILFQDKNQLGRGLLELVDGVLPPIVQSITLDPQEFTPAGFTFQVTANSPDRWMSSAVPGADQLNLANGLHTFALFANNFTGKFWVQGSLEPEPSTDVIPPGTDWFDIDVEGTPNPLIFDKFTGIAPYNFFANLNWVRFLYEVDPLNQGELTKIQYVP